MADNDQGKKLDANTKLLDASNDLANVLASTDRPNWLNETIGFTQDFKNQNKTPESIRSGSSWALLQRAIKIYPQAMDHSWKLGAHGHGVRPYILHIINSTFI